MHFNSNEEIEIESNKGPTVRKYIVPSSVPLQPSLSLGQNVDYQPPIYHAGCCQLDTQSTDVHRT